MNNQKQGIKFDLKEVLFGLLGIASAAILYFIFRYFNIMTDFLDMITGSWSNILIALIISAAVPIIIYLAIVGNKNSKFTDQRVNEVLSREAAATGSAFYVKAYGLMIEMTGTRAANLPCYLAVSADRLAVVLLDSVQIPTALCTFLFNEMSELKIKPSTVPMQHMITVKSGSKKITLRVSEKVAKMPKQQENLQRVLSALQTVADSRADMA